MDFQALVYREAFSLKRSIARIRTSQKVAMHLLFVVEAQKKARRMIEINLVASHVDTRTLSATIAIKRAI